MQPAPDLDVEGGGGFGVGGEGDDLLVDLGDGERGRHLLAHVAALAVEHAPDAARAVPHLRANCANYTEIMNFIFIFYHSTLSISNDKFYQLLLDFNNLDQIFIVIIILTQQMILPTS